MTGTLNIVLAPHIHPQRPPEVRVTSWWCESRVAKVAKVAAAAVAAVVVVAMLVDGG